MATVVGKAKTISIDNIMHHRCTIACICVTWHFDTSTEANILHAVVSIDGEDSCPGALAGAFPMLRNHRFSVQCRLRYK